MPEESDHSVTECPKNPRKGKFKRMIVLLCLIVAGLIGGLFCFQRKLIYFPQRYDAGYQVLKTQMGERLQEVVYGTSAGRQVAFYLPPRAEPLSVPWPPVGFSRRQCRHGAGLAGSGRQHSRSGGGVLADRLSGLWHVRGPPLAGQDR